MTDDQNTNPYEQQSNNQTPQNPQEEIENKIPTEESVEEINNAEVEDLKEQLSQAKSQLEAMTAACQRALADLQNIKRRNEEEKASFISFANINLIKALLPDIENVNRAINHEPKDQEWITGAAQVMQQLLTDLEKNGLQRIPTVGQVFNPQIHEALLTGPGAKDQVIAELEVGYTLNDKVVKRARVTVGTGE